MNYYEFRQSVPRGDPTQLTANTSTSWGGAAQHPQVGRMSMSATNNRVLNAAASQLSSSLNNSASPTSISTSNVNLVDFYIGLALAVSSSIFIGSSFIIKKKALIKLANNEDISKRASEGGYGYLKEWLWWMGVITMGAGEACNFAAYAFAPASLVTPLGALSVLVTAILSSKLLKERLNLLGKIGCAVCLLGSTSIVIHSPKEEEVSTMADLALKMKDAVFILYVIVILVITLFVIIYVAPRYGRSNILVYISICSLIGSFSVISVKGLGLAIKETISGRQQVTNTLTWFWLIAVIACVSVQLIYLNKSLDIYNTSMVTPIYYVFFTTFVIVASSILYKEWACLGASDVIGNVIGFLTTIIGIFLMQLFRDVEIPLKRFHSLMHNQTMTINQMDIMNSTTCLVDYGTPGNGHIPNGGVNHHGYSRHLNHGSVDSRDSRDSRGANNNFVVYS